MSNEVCDGAKDGISVEKYFVGSCLFILSGNEKNLAFSINSLSKLDVVYSRRVLQRIQDFQILRQSKAWTGRWGNCISLSSRR